MCVLICIVQYIYTCVELNCIYKSIINTVCIYLVELEVWNKQLFLYNQNFTTIILPINN